MARARGRTAPAGEVVLGSASPASFVKNDYNPNVMDPFMYEKAIESIRTYGFIDPITVREVDGELVIIDGEHRVRAALEMGIPKIPYIQVDVDDVAARKLTIILNELKGRYDAGKMSELLTGILADSSVEELTEALPFQPEALRSMIGLKSFDWNGLLDDRKAPEPSNKGDRWVEKSFRLPADAAAIVDQALARMRDRAPGAQDSQALELICAEFLASS